LAERIALQRVLKFASISIFQVVAPERYPVGNAAMVFMRVVAVSTLLIASRPAQGDRAFSKTLPPLWKRLRTLDLAKDPAVIFSCMWNNRF
jgi:hypothetical protein